MVSQICPESGVPGRPCSRDCDWGTGCKRQVERAIRAESMASALAQRVREMEAEASDLRRRAFGYGVSREP